MNGAGTKAAVLGAFDAGASVVSYVGHGAAATWASEAILTSFDVPLLQPQAEQPVLLTLNCLNGYFVAPSFALANLLPRHLDFRRAAVVSAIIGFVILPWNLKTEIMAQMQAVRNWGCQFVVPIPELKVIP